MIMKFLRIFLLVLLMLSAAATPVFAQKTQDFCIELNDLVNDRVGPEKAKGAVLSIVRNGKTEFLKGYGFADEYNGFAADGEKTAFRIGSVSKTFVAVAAVILRQDGQLDMNSDVSIYLEPDFPSLSYPVTMHQLLTHTAGFEDIVTGMAVKNVSDTEPLSISVRKYLPEQVFRPGEAVSYSNYGIALAAYVVERIAGQDFAQFCREKIFLPLGMKRTTYEYMHDVAYVSKPYLPNGNETLEPYMNLYPEGSAVSTAEDMANYMQWLLNKEDTRVLSAKSKEDMFKRQFTMSEELGGMGYIWNRKTRNGATYYDKKGETLHFYTRIALYPEAQTGIFLSFNTYLPEHEINAVMESATDLLYGAETHSDSGQGKSTMNISGYYANNWSSFKTPEKILRYLVPGKMLTISGLQNSGFSLNGEKMTLIGEDTYSSDIGNLKFLEKDGKIIIATESAITYSKVPFWQHGVVQVVVPLLFFVLSLVYFLRELVLKLGKSNKYTTDFLTCSLVQILSFTALCLLMVNGIMSFSLLTFALPMKICGWIIAAACAAGIGFIINNKTKGHPLNLLPMAWNMAGILFCLWMLWMKIM